MSRQGHYAKVKRPSGPELYEDASRVLDELLQNHLQKGEYSRPRRFKTHPPRMHIPAGGVLDEREELGLDDRIGERSKTMPSIMRGSSRDAALKDKELKALEKISKRPKSPADGSASSADTEGDSFMVRKGRKKKSVFQRAKDRFLHIVHREEREKDAKIKGSSPKTSPRKQKKKASPRAEDKLNKNSQEKGDKRNGTLDSKDSLFDSNGKRRGSAGKDFFNTIRRSISMKRGDRIKNLTGGQSISSKSDPPSPDKDGNFPSQPQPSSRPAPPPQESAVTDLLVPGGAAGHRKGSSISAQNASASPYPYSSSTDSVLKTSGAGGDKSSSLYSFASALNGHSVLDNPGEDFEFMDDDGEGDYVELRNGGGGEDASHRTVFQSGGGGGGGGGKGARALKHQSSLCTDGGSELDQEDGKLFDNEVPLHERTEAEKDEMYGKIAQKLINIGENYAVESGMSDAETTPRGAASHASSDSDMNDLERQILECLRDLGDRNADMIDKPTEEMVEKKKAELYDRFQQTVQHSMGEEVSWNHLAMLFYTTKGVVSAVGRGSQVAGAVKEMTLRYFSDKFAKWIMDQGGFDSVLSESDSELD